MATVFTFTTIGRIQYDPPRGNMRRRTQWWCVIHLDREISRYYRWWLDREWWRVESRRTKRTYHQPSWDCHCSVVRGEKPRNPAAWRQFDGQQVEVRYSGEIRYSGDTDQQRPDWFFFIPCEVDLIPVIRQRLGLPNQALDGRPYTNHITISRTYE